MSDEPANPGPAKVVAVLRNPVLWFVLVQVPLLFIFYDAWNSNTIFLSSSYLALGLNPYEYQNQVPGGLVIQFLNLIAYYVFRATQSNYLLTAAGFKLLFLALTLLTGLVLGRVAELERLPYHRKIAYAFLFNPFVLFVNDVWVETDSIVILLYVLGYVALRYGWDRTGENRFLVLSALCIGLAVFSYYSIVLLVPTLILYRAGRRRKLLALTAFVGVGAFLAAPLVIFHLTSLFDLAGGLQSASSGVGPSSAFNLLPKLTDGTLVVAERGALAATVTAALVLPWVLRRFGVKEPVCLFAAFSVAFLVFVNGVPQDNFVLLVGLLMLALIAHGRPSLSYARIFGLQLFLLPQFLIFEMFDGFSGSTGVYYWSYYQFHARANLYQWLGGRGGWQILLLLYLVGFSITLTYFFVRHAWQTALTGDLHPEVPVTPTTARALIHRRPRRSTVGFAIALAIALLFPLGLLGNPSLGTPVAPLVGFDAGEFLPLQYGIACAGAPECGYALSSPATYEIDAANASVHFAAASAPIGLFRNLTDQSVSLGLTASVRWGSLQSADAIDLVNATSFYAGQSIAAVITSGSALTPSSTGGPITASNAGPIPVLQGASQQFEFDGNGVRSYALNLPSLAGRSVVFAVELTSHAHVQDLLWDSLGPKVSYAAFASGDAFTLGYRSGPATDWRYWSTEMPAPLNRWFLTGFAVDPGRTNLTAFVNAETLSAPFSPGGAGNVVLNVGKANASTASDHNSSLSGFTTDLYVVDSSAVQYRPFDYAWSSQSGSIVLWPSRGPLGLTLSGPASGPKSSVDGTLVSAQGINSAWLGKLSDSPHAVDLSFPQLTVGSTSAGPNLALVVVDFGAVIPLILAAWCLLPRLAGTRDRVPRRGERPQDDSPPTD
ncbi:MAG: hypothetical protein L3K23_07540 [Thermoplasmata archaeon]|nr:hypothetical protein [Thermoplasmata archaeon]